ncbi:MAG TPA: DNA methyltransferase [Chloroflexota bacterium]
MPEPLTLAQFVARWKAATLTERSGAQQHFIDLCEVLGQPRPAAVDQTGQTYTFEKGVTTTGGGHGWADVWKRGHFAWEYKGRHKDLGAAYQQLQRYREDLQNPPLLVVCDLDRFEVHTNFTNTVKLVYAFDLADLASLAPTPGTHGLPPLDVLRAVFADPERLRPGTTPAQVTERAAAEFARLADSMRRRGADPEQAAHFLMRLLFCLFAEDIGLLPMQPLTQLVTNWQSIPSQFQQSLRGLFATMATGGAFGPYAIPFFDGGLFADDTALELTVEDLRVLARVAALDWASVEPAIFGTLFERSLDPDKRSQLGAHYTSRDDIELIVEPVLMAPLRRRWAEVRARADEAVARRDAVLRELGGRRDAAAERTRRQHEEAVERLLRAFADEVAGVRVLDPACGSGNFLYVALKHLLDLEKEVNAYRANNRMTPLFPLVEPAQLHGIEVNPYARELAQVVVWIGYIQWLNDNGYNVPAQPILKPLDNIALMDAIMAHDASGLPVEPPWPQADVIIGNPPFLGGKRLRTELGDEYVNELFRLYEGRVPHEADLSRSM